MAPSLAGLTGHVVAFLDLGTYSVRLLIVRFNPNGSYTVLAEEKESVRLGGGEFLEKHLQTDAMQRAALVCSKFAEMARQFKAEEIVAVATAATREAENQRTFVRLLRKQAHIDVRVVSGKEEARLIYLGVSRGCRLDGKTALFIDIGGGSTEIIVGNETNHLYLDSLKVGSVRLSQMLHLDDPNEIISPRRLEFVKRFVRNTAIRTLQNVKKLAYDLVVGSSGTILNLGAMAQALRGEAPVREPVYRRKELREIIRRLCAVSLAERRKFPGLNADRADIIVGGAAILETLLEDLGIEEIRTTQFGLRDGLLVNYLVNRDTAHADLLNNTRVRHRSILLLGRNCGFDEAHALNIVRLTLGLFDSARACGLHEFGDWERELLEYAALLHDVGVFLSFVNHQAHSYYLIRNADLVGFDQTEIAIIAALARYHRKGVPNDEHPEFAQLDKRGRKIVARLFVLLRLAESLERAHAGVVTRAQFERSDKRTVALRVAAQGDCTLEIWGVQKHLKAFSKVFEHELQVLPPEPAGPAAEAAAPLAPALAPAPLPAGPLGHAD